MSAGCQPVGEGQSRQLFVLSAVPAASQRFDRTMRNASFIKKLCDMRIKSLRQALQDRDGGVFDSPFQSAHIGTINGGIHRQAFLG